VEVNEYRLAEEDQICPCCQGSLHEMSSQVREELKLIPAQVSVLRHVQYIYACRRCERENLTTPIIKAQMPKLLLPGSLASFSILAYIMDHCLNQWTNLNNFLLDGRLEIYNNRAERSIKSFVIGRKNFLFSNTPRGARSSAIIYSIIETAKENNLKPFDYLVYLFEHLPNVDTNNLMVVDNLLPWSNQLPDNCRMPVN
jgi:hypothetical protein